MKNTEKILALVGPTASGKTSLAVNIAKQIGGEIISADSRIVYKDFNIGTAKPTEEEMRGVPHHLVGSVCPAYNYTVDDFKKDSECLIEEIRSRGNVPIIAGGTGFYIKGLLGGLELPPVAPDEDFRTEMEKLGKEKGFDVVHNILKEIDSVSAEKIHPNNLFRVIRAIEVTKKLGIPMSKAQKMSTPKYNVIYAGLTSESREFLYNRINKRVDVMLEQGLIEEVNCLINKYGKTLSLLKTLGYKEISEYLDGEISLADAIELIKKNTRNFAKRQLTWFRANPDVHWFYIDKMSLEEISKEVIRLL